MITLLPPSHHPLRQIPSFNPHTRPLPVTKSQGVSDSFGNPERQKLLQLLKNPIIFEAVLDETQKPSRDVEYLRALLAKQKVSTRELFASPELQVNFYDHLAKELDGKSKAAKGKEKQQDFKLQSVMMASVAKRLREQHGLPASSIYSLKSTTNIAPQSDKPKFGGFMVGLFNDVVRAFADQGDWRSMTEEQRRKKGKKIIDWGSAIAATSAGALSTFMFADDAALTAVTVGTITNLSYSVYGQKGVDSSTLAVVLGKLATARITDAGAEYALEKGLGMIPLLGEIIAGSSAYAVHKATGKLFLEYFEHQIKRNREPKLPTSIGALASALNLADGLDLLDLDGQAQLDLQNSMNDLRIAQGDFEAGPSNYMELPGTGRVQEVRTLLDQNGNLTGLRGKDDVVHKLLSKTSDVRNVYKLVEALSKTSPKVARDAYNEFQTKGSLSYTTASKIMDEAKNITSGTLTLFGDPDCVGKLGMLETSPGSLAFVPAVGALYDIRDAREKERIAGKIPAVVNINQVDSKGQTPLYRAALAGDLNAVNNLLSSGADVNQANSKNSSSLVLNASERRLKSKGLHALAAEISKLDEGGDTPLIAASYTGKLGIIHSLTKAGADVDKPDNYGGTPLIAAAAGNKVNAIRLLLQAHADVDKLDKDGADSLFAAAIFGDPESISVLVKAGADVNRMVNGGTTPLHGAAMLGTPENIQALVQHGAKVDGASKYILATTPLYMAALAGRSDNIAALLSAGAKIDKANEERTTPVHIAAAAGNVQALKTLIKAGADIYKPDKEGNTPLNTAISHKQTITAQILKAHGAR